MNDLQNFSDVLHTLVTERPDEYIPILESAAREVAIQLSAKGHDEEQLGVNSDKIAIQAQLKNFQRITQIRNLAADHVGKLVTIRGIVVSASKPRIKATNLSIMCRSQCFAHTQRAPAFLLRAGRDELTLLTSRVVHSCRLQGDEGDFLRFRFRWCSFPAHVRHEYQCWSRSRRTQCAEMPTGSLHHPGG